VKKTLRILIIVSTTIFLLILIWEVSERVFFTRNFIFSGNHYSFTNKYSDEEFKYEFNPKNLVFKNNGCLVNLFISKRYDTSIYLEKVRISGNHVYFVIECKTAWRYQGGTALTNYSYNNDGSCSTVMERYKLLNSEGKEIPYQTTSSDDNTLYLDFDKSLLNNSDNLTLYFKGFNEVTYTRNGI
jgi:hypothetical protein